jgi:hypothetical protein
MADTGTKIINCINLADIVSDYACAGGVVGHFESYGGKIMNCINLGSVTGIILQGRGVGGIAGHIVSGSVVNCVNANFVCGENAVGGVVGTTFAHWMVSILSSINVAAVKGINRVSGTVVHVD